MKMKTVKSYINSPLDINQLLNAKLSNKFRERRNLFYEKYLQHPPPVPRSYVIFHGVLVSEGVEICNGSGIGRRCPRWVRPFSHVAGHLK